MKNSDIENRFKIMTSKEDEENPNNRDNEQNQGKSARENDGKVDGHTTRKSPSDEMGYEDRVDDIEETGINESMGKDRDPHQNKEKKAKIGDMNSSRRQPDKTDKPR